MFMIFLTSVFAAFTVFSVLFAYMLRTVFPNLIRGNVYVRVFLFNAVLLAGLYFSTFLHDKLSFLWIGRQLIIIIFISEIFSSALNAVIRLAALVYNFFIRNNDAHAVDESRRNFLLKASLLPLEGMILYGSFIEKNDIVLNRYHLKIKNAGALSGLKIAQLTDAHIGSFFSLEKLKHTLDRLAALNADILAVTGDIFDDDNLNGQAVALLGRYCSEFRHGVYFCWGNHEYMRDMRSIRHNLDKTSVNILTNRHVDLDIAGKKLSVIGVDYPHDRSRFTQLSSNYMEEALTGVPENSVKILLAHHSDFIDNAFAADIDLVLTGHTHGGQLGLFGHPLFPGFKYIRGMFENGASYGYVSTGAGSWFPFRLGCPPEITLFTLE